MHQIFQVFGVSSFFLILFTSCYSIKSFKIYLDPYNINSTYQTDSVAKFLTPKEIREYKKGNKALFYKNGVQYRTYERIHEGQKIINTEGYFCTDAQVGAGKEYHPNGKVSVEWNFILYNDSLQKVIDTNEFNRMCRKKGWNGYQNSRQGQWKYYSETGNLIKIEDYEKGKLIKTINY